MPVAAGSRQQARHVQQQSRFASTHTRECHGQSTGGLRSLGSGGVTRWARTLFLRWINKLSAPRPVWGGINTLTGWGGAAADEVGGVQVNTKSNRDRPGGEGHCANCVWISRSFTVCLILVEI